MKIRQGFVSNSSSSSFIVAFPDKIPTTVDGMRQLLFGDGPVNFPYWDQHEGDEDIITADNIAARVIDDLKSKTRATDEAIVELVSSDCYGHDGAPDYDAFQTGDEQHDWKAYKLATKEWAKKRVDIFLRSGGWVFYNIFIVEYSDNSGALELAMEHSDIFRNLPHMRVSHH